MISGACCRPAEALHHIIFYYSIPKFYHVVNYFLSSSSRFGLGGSRDPEGTKVTRLSEEFKRSVRGSRLAIGNGQWAIRDIQQTPGRTSIRSHEYVRYRAARPR